MTTAIERRSDILVFHKGANVSRFGIAAAVVLFLIARIFVVVAEGVDIFGVVERFVAVHIDQQDLFRFIALYEDGLFKTQVGGLDPIGRIAGEGGVQPYGRRHAGCGRDGTFLDLDRQRIGVIGLNEQSVVIIIGRCRGGVVQHNLPAGLFFRHDHVGVRQSRLIKAVKIGYRSGPGQQQSTIGAQRFAAPQIAEHAHLFLIGRGSGIFAATDDQQQRQVKPFFHIYSRGRHVHPRTG